MLIYSYSLAHSTVCTLDQTWVVFQSCRIALASRNRLFVCYKREWKGSRCPVVCGKQRNGAQIRLSRSAANASWFFCLSVPNVFVSQSLRSCCALQLCAKNLNQTASTSCLNWKKTIAQLRYAAVSRWKWGWQYDHPAATFLAWPYNVSRIVNYFGKEHTLFHIQFDPNLSHTDSPVRKWDIYLSALQKKHSLVEAYENQLPISPR